MKERPILFSAPMVRAILEGRKTQTRRIVKFRNPIRQAFSDYAYKYDTGGYKCPYGNVGDRLWVRETFVVAGTGKVFYRADDEIINRDWSWRPSIFMPRWASRITLEITGVRVERVQDISEDKNVNDIFEEGIPKTAYSEFDANGELSDIDTDSALEDFKELWDSINAPRGFGWNENPWVWVIEFERVEK